MAYFKSYRTGLGVSIEDMSKRSGLNIETIERMEKAHPIYGGDPADRLLEERLSAVLRDEMKKQDEEAGYIVQALLARGFSVNVQQHVGYTDCTFSASMEGVPGQRVEIKGKGASKLKAINFAKAALAFTSAAFDTSGRLEGYCVNIDNGVASPTERAA